MHTHPYTLSYTLSFSKRLQPVVFVLLCWLLYHVHLNADWSASLSFRQRHKRRHTQWGLFSARVGLPGGREAPPKPPQHFNSQGTMRCWALMNNKRLFIKMINRTETNYTKCWDEKSFGCRFPSTSCVVCVWVCVSNSDLAKGGRQKEGEVGQGP